MNNNDNKFINLIYNKPHNFIKRFIYYIKVIKPVYNKLKSGPMSYDDMREFSDFIKILEMVFFYKNDTKSIESDIIKIVSDNNIRKNSEGNKNLTVLDTINKVTIIFDMIRKDDIDTITIRCNNNFGKQLSTTFIIVDSKVVNFNLDQNTYNLLYNINHTLNKCVADLFLEYYKKA